MTMMPKSAAKDPLLCNALEAIENGMEDFADGRPTRVSSALRNLCAGVLLLLKEKLRQESPPNSNGSLIYKKLVPSRVNGAIVMVGKGKATIDVEDMRDRFEALGLDIEWKRVFAIRDARNAVEHHRATLSHAAMQEVIAETFRVLVEIFEHLGLAPAHVLSDTAWGRMLEETETFKALEKACKDSQKPLSGIPDIAQGTFDEWLSCPACGSGLLKATGSSYSDASFACQACGAVSETTPVMEAALANEYAGEAYAAVKDGAEDPVATCPNCAAHTFVVDSDVCYVCGEGRSYVECLRCGNGLSVDEQELDGLCGYCSHVMSKDD